MREKLLLSGFLFGLCLTGVYAQNMKLLENTGGKTVYDLQNIQKMSFSSGNLMIMKKDKSSESYLLNEIKRLDFSILITEVEKVVLEDDGLKVYPNPVENVVNIGVSEKGLLRVLTVDGKTMYSEEVEAGIFSLDMNAYSSGIYICMYNNDTVVKIERIIKQ
jgi:hypothetical protein